MFGSVKDSLTGENLIGAVIILRENNQGINTNNYGFYSLPVSSGKQTISCSFMGYSTITKSVEIKKNTKLNFALIPKVNSLDEVTIQGSKSTLNSTSVSKNVIGINRIKSITTMTGEPDVLKSLQLLPGVQTAGEGSTNLSAVEVRSIRI